MGVKGKIKRALIVVILAVLAIVTIFPIWFLIVNSFKGQQEIVASPIALPKSWNLDYLKNAAEQINLGSSLLQTVLITVAAVAGTQEHTGSDPHVRRIWNQYVGSAVQRIHQEHPVVT